MIIVGDLHGEFREFLTELEVNNIRDTTVIQVGDLGLGFQVGGKDRYNLQVLNDVFLERNISFYAIRGNHDNPEYWRVDEEGPYLKEVHNLSNLHLVPDYSILTIDNKKVLFVGGAISIDRLLRVEGKTYWKDEGVVYDTNKLRELTQSVDIIITHTAPIFAYPRGFNDLVDTYIQLERKHGKDLETELITERQYMNTISVLFPAKEHYYGHFHKNNWEYIDGTRYVCVGILSMYDTIKHEYIVNMDHIMGML